MSSDTIIFSQKILNLMESNFKQQFPIEALKNMTVIPSSSLTSKKYYDVTIPKNIYLPNGFWWAGTANDPYDAKRQAIGSLIENKDTLEHLQKK